MKKELYLLRHAQAHERSSGQEDFDRELNSTGLQNATRMGMNLKNSEVQFDMIISSPAIRALTTASLIAEQLKYDTDRIHKNDEIYEASVRTFLSIINNLKEEWQCVLITGHNPAITYLVEYISKAEIGNMTTCGVCHIQFDGITWAEVSEGTGTLASYEYPDLLEF